MVYWENGITKATRAHEEAATLRAQLYALEAQHEKAKARIEHLERENARLVRENRDGFAAIGRLQAALTLKGEK